MCGADEASGSTGALVAAVENKHGEKSNEGAGGIEEGVPSRGSAGSDEGLMKLVESGIEGGHEPCGERPAPVPARTRAPNAAIKKHEENEVFQKMRCFADEMVHVEDVILRGGGKQPAESWIDETAGVFGREGIGGRRKNDHGPQERWPPDAKPCEDHVFAWHVEGDFVEIRVGAWIQPGAGRGHSVFSFPFYFKRKMKDCRLKKQERDPTRITCKQGRTPNYSIR